MNFHFLIFNKTNVLKALYIFIFYIFVTPYSFGIANEGVSGNYLFLLFPVFVVLIKREIVWPPKSVILFMLLLSLIFIVGFYTKAEYSDLILRRTASFIAFMVVFSFMFVKITQQMINAFKSAIILWSLINAFLAIIDYVILDGNNSGVYGKGMFGTQRIGFVYLIGFWLVTFTNPSSYLLKVCKFIVAFIIIAGIFLTYTRTSILGFSASLAAYFFYLLAFNLRNKLSIKECIKKLFSKLFLIFMQLILAMLVFTGPAKYYSTAIFDYIFSKHHEYVEDDELNLYTSWTVYFVNNVSKGQTSMSRMQDTFLESQQEDILNNIIERVSMSSEITLAKKEIKNAEGKLDDLKLKHKNIQSKISDASAEKNEVYKDFINQENEIIELLEDKKNELKNLEFQKEITINRLLTIELQLLVVDLKRQQNALSDKDSIESIKKKINYLNKKITDLADKSILLSNKDQNDSMVLLRMKDKGTSIGYRVFMHKKIFDETVKSPWFGSSFMGVWALFDNKKGSTHSQYLDILYRVGIIAFLVYLIFISKVTAFLYKKDLGLFFGFIGFLFFGLFHETIKLSQGGFIFSFLFAMWSQQKNLLIEPK